jgi:hypothetical protein
MRDRCYGSLCRSIRDEPNAPWTEQKSMYSVLRISVNFLSSLYNNITPGESRGFVLVWVDKAAMFLRELVNWTILWFYVHVHDVRYVARCT